ncbi:hypothetical protein KIPB_003381 [Kipferlia bialata]|uniref:Uncharacterized protein n=1 Tax=Kipferlia bialata TaxID=797122 RepID=A0A9K3GH70_9EUKA|nr:hypothetical protein KIPB_003381 [Kipferlia bialata]|eukprot:g3381.t1
MMPLPLSPPPYRYYDATATVSTPTLVDMGYEAGTEITTISAGSYASFVVLGSDGHTSWWVWVLLVLLVIALVGGVTWFLVLRKNRVSGRSGFKAFV